MTLGGRIAEEIVYGKEFITTGASNDLEKVTQMARAMVTKYGMSEKLGNLAYGKSEDHVFMGRDFGHQRDYSEEIAAELDKEVKSIIDETNVEVLKFHSLSNLSEYDRNSKKDFVSISLENINLLKQELYK